MNTIIYKTVNEMNEDERQKFVKMTGEIMLGITEGRSTVDIGKKLNLHPWHVESNINEALYVLRNHVGKWEYFKMLFKK